MDLSTSELILIGRVRAMDDRRTDAEAVAIADGRIVAVGTADSARTMLPGAPIVDLGSAAILPGFVEAHGHPTTEAIMVSEPFVDIRPTLVRDADDVMGILRREVARSGSDGAYLIGWDPLLQRGLPNLDSAFLDDLAPGTPLAILHNSLHSVYFNSAAATAAGVDASTSDPPGATWGRDAHGRLTGVGYETGTILTILAPALNSVGDLTERLRAESARLNAVGVTTSSDMSFDPAHRVSVAAAQRDGVLSVRLRLYETSNSALTSDIEIDNGDDMVRQIGIKTWADGSPWVGNIATSFPYLDTPATQLMGLPPGHRGAANYSRAELDTLFSAYFDQGWQLACHAHGDEAVTTVLDAWTELLGRAPRSDHRLRLEHCGAMRADQFQRAAELGVTCSLFVTHLHYWGDVLLNDLFGEHHGSRWMAAGSAVRAGATISLHNDNPITPETPLLNITVAMTRRSPSGQVLAPRERLTLDEALRAQTIDAAYQLFADDVIGSITPGKYADLVVLSADPGSVPAEDIAHLRVLATFLEGRQVHGTPLHR